MIRSAVIGFLLCLGYLSAQAQLISAERSAFRQLEKQRWAKAHLKLQKAMRKDSASASGRYVCALYFFNPLNPAFQIDSAYRYTMRSLSSFYSASPKKRERWKRFPLDTMMLVRLRERIDSAAFERAKSINTEKAYVHFLQAFPLASHRQEATVLRDEAAYQDALKENTYQAFLSYINRYPNASHAPEARTRYEKLLFESMTRDKRLKSFENFIREYPTSPHRAEAEKNIFEIATASGEVKSFLSFVEQHPHSPWTKRAVNMLFYLLDEQDEIPWPANFLNDSLKNVQRLREGYLVPFLHEGRFGFMDKSGKEVIAPIAAGIDQGYLCGNITEDVVVIKDQVLGRNGAPVYAGPVSEIDDLGAGFLKIDRGDCVLVVHKTGFRMGDCVQEAKVVHGRLLALRQNGRWSLWTLSGKRLFPYEWDDIGTANGFIFFKQGQNLKLATLDALAGLADQKTFSLSDPYQEVKAWPQDLLWIKANDREGVLSRDLKTVIEPAKHKLTATASGILAERDENFSLFSWKGECSEVFQQVRVHEPWTAIKKAGHWRLFDPSTAGYSDSTYDSIWFAGPFLIASTADTLRAYFSHDNYLDIPQPAHTSFIPGKDSTSFLLIEKDEKKSVYNLKGTKLFTVTYDEIQYAGQGFFIASKKEKKGLLNATGKLVLPVEYHAIGNVSNNMVSLLKAMKFGLYNVKNNKLIKPQYDKNLNLYTPERIMAYTKGAFGFIDWDNKPVGEFSFIEIRYWNDTVAMVKKDSYFQLYHIESSEVLEDRIKNYELIQDTAAEKLAIIQQDNAFGVWSNRRDIVIPVTFSDIKNLGSPEEPLYFTEKHVEEASIFVVIYYDKDGKMLRREVYEEEDYDKIYCAD
ncbi:MAG: WG repeat-containing protein [Bacteroidota bacterium]